MFGLLLYSRALAAWPARAALPAVDASKQLATAARQDYFGDFDLLLRGGDFAAKVDHAPGECAMVAVNSC